MEISIKLDREHLKYHPDSGKVYFTYDTIEKIPEWPDGPLIEIIQGELFMAPSPSLTHQRISLNIATILKAFIDENELGVIYTAPVDVILSDDNVVIPDILFVSSKREGVLSPQNVRGVPDLIVEILSQNKSRDLVQKMALYEKFKLNEYWIVDPDDRHVSVYHLNKDGEKFSACKDFKGEMMLLSRTIKNFKVPVSEFFK